MAKQIKKGKNQHVDGWTKEEVEYLREKIGTFSIEVIAKKLNRTVEACESKMNKLGITLASETTEYVSILELSKLLKVDYKTILRWVEKYDFPIQYIKLKTKKKVVSVEDFWKWATLHKEKINWFNLEPLVLIPEPEWVDEARAKDYYKKSPKKPWTIEEDRLLWTLYYTYGMQQKEIAKRLDRTASSVESRLKRLRENGFAEKMKGYKSRNLSELKITDYIPKTTEKKKIQIDWTPEEDIQLWTYYYQDGLSYKQIADKFEKRTTNAVEKRLRRLKGKGFELPGVVVPDMKEKAPNWTPEEDEQLWIMRFIENLGYKEIEAKFPHRSVLSLRSRCSYLRQNNFGEQLGLHVTNTEVFWSDEEKNELYRLFYVERLPRKEIALRMGRTTGAIDSALNRMRKNGYIQGIVFEEQNEAI